MVSRTKRFMGHRTHGRGKKAGRGAGKRGGRGGAGRHKHKYISIVKYTPDWFGRHGFKRPQGMVGSLLTLNVRDLGEMLPRLEADGGVKKSGGKVSVDLTAIGFDKLLGGGTIDRAIEVHIKSASKKAIEKIEAAGGKVITQ